MPKKDYVFYGEVIELPEFNARLYTRRSDKKGIWQLRIKPRNAKAIIKSTKTSVRSEAIEVAEDWYARIKASDRAGIDTTLDLTFSSVFQHFLRDEKATISPNRLAIIEQVIGKYAEPYFGSTPITSISSASYKAFKVWRRKYWIEGPGVREAQQNPSLRYAKDPAPATLDYEHAAFVQILRWARITYALPTLIIPTGYKHRKGIKKTRGGHFSLDEYLILRQHLSERIEKPKDKFGKPFTLNPTHLFQRRRLRHIVHFIVGTMVRPSEAYRLKWRHIRWENDEDYPEREYVLVRVPADISKTKEERITIGTNVCAARLRDWKSQTLHSGEDDFVFPNQAGNMLSDQNKTFKKALSELRPPLTHSEDGIRFSLYSCRHYGITCALRRNDGEIRLIDVALMAGTSVHHIEKTYYNADIERRAARIAFQERFYADD
jgi:integrase